MTQSNRHEFVITAHGQSPHLEACIQSVLTQTRKPEVIAISTSTPSTFLTALAGRYQLDLRVNPLESRIGINWNFALASTKEKWVTLGHQDDLYRPAYSLRMLEAMGRHADALIAFSDSTEQLEDAEIAPSLNLRIKRRLTKRAFAGREAISSPRDKTKLLAWGNPICCPSVMFNRHLLGRFSFSELMQSNLDWDAWTDLAASPGDFVYVPERLVSKRVHRGSETSALLVSSVRQREDAYMFRRFWPAPVAAAIALVYRLGYLANTK
jgi:glycosyltransferase involved in cell wall biosynthesis